MTDTRRRFNVSVEAPFSSTEVNITASGNELATSSRVLVNSRSSSAQPIVVTANTSNRRDRRQGSSKSKSRKGRSRINVRRLLSDPVDVFTGSGQVSVTAPGTNVDVDGGNVSVRAPGTQLNVGNGRLTLRAPGTRVEIDENGNVVVRAPGTNVTGNGRRIFGTAPGTYFEAGNNGVIVQAPGTNVQINGNSGTVTAPGTNVQFNSSGISVTAPGTNVQFNGSSGSVTAPGTNVQFTPSGVSVVAPGTNVQVNTNGMTFSGFGTTVQVGGPNGLVSVQAPGTNVQVGGQNGLVSVQAPGTTVQVGNSTGTSTPPLIVNYGSQTLGQAPAVLQEASGLARGSGNYWWSHNDSGNSATLYAVDDTGTITTQVAVNGATNVDWEDLAVGRYSGVSGRVLFIGDFGNNQGLSVGTRTNQAIYVVPEPGVSDTSVNVVATLPIQYPSSNYDIEAMAYDPMSQSLVLVTKDLSFAGQSRIFVRSLDPANSQLIEVGTLDLSNRSLGPDRLITGVAVSDSGNEVIVRTYQTAFRWVRSANEGLSTTFAKTPQVITLTSEPQGEAIAFAGDGSFYTISEQQPRLIRYSPT